MLHTKLTTLTLLALLSSTACSADLSYSPNTDWRAGGTAVDTYVGKGFPNQNRGNLETLRIQQNGNNRAIVAFDRAELEAELGQAPRSIILELEIADNGNNWGTGGREVGIHRMTQAWTEDGATWNCGNDAVLTNGRPDCGGTEWEMGKKNQPEFHPWVEVATDTIIIASHQGGTVSFDVTADVETIILGGIQNFGWIIKKTEEGQAGRIEFFAAESGQGPSLQNISNGCGDGIRNGSEECDMSDLGGVTCSGLGYGNYGSLFCDGSCNFDVSGCTCGNGVRNGSEVCDGEDLGGETCSGLGYDGGSLSCVTHSPGGDENCTFNVSDCTVCGDGVKNGSEDCDGTNLGGQTCQGLGYDGGSLSCDGSCSFDVSACIGNSCGDGVAKSGFEECDGADLRGMTCLDFGYRSGFLFCDGSCNFDASDCNCPITVCPA